MATLLPALLFVQAPLAAGFASVDITPNEPLPLGGYTQRNDSLMEGVGDRLFARALVLQQGQTQVALVSAEMLTIPGSLTKEVRRRLQEAGFRGALLIAATHTHCAPDSQMLNDRMRAKVPGIATFNSKWLRWFAERLTTAVLEAKPTHSVKPKLRTGNAPGLNRSRRQQEGSTPPDPRVTSIDFTYSHTAASILHFSAHPTVYTHTWNRTSGDWPGAWASQGAKRLFFNGALGDVSPAPPSEGDESARVQSMAHALDAVPLTEHSVGLDTLAVSDAQIKLPQPAPHPDFAAANGVPPPLASSLVRGFAPPEASVTVVRLGGLVLIGIPGEPTAAVGRLVERAAIDAGAKYPIVIALANEWVGYILTREEYEAGGYESTLSFYGPALADRVLDAVRMAVAGTCRK